MKAATIQELKEELQQLPEAQLLECCLRLARFKKENKELLTYLLFESHDNDGYIDQVKTAITTDFENINKSQIYFAKKSLRKILRTINKYIRYTGSKLAEAEWLIHYCKELKASGIPIKQHAVINNLMHQQLKKIRKVISAMHEDLQYDYTIKLQELEN